MEKRQLFELQKEFGKAFYLLDPKQFRKNFTELKETFSALYQNFNIATPYKKTIRQNLPKCE
jgi:diaminopimelate decarboxylase